MELFFLIVYIFEAVIAFIYFSDNFNLRKGAITSFLIAVGLYLIAYFANIVDHNTNYINGIFFFSVNVIFSKICFEINIKNSIFHSSFLLTVMFLSELITESGVSYILKIPIDAYKNNFAALFMIGTLSKLLYLIICKIVSYIFSYKKNSITNNKRLSLLFLYPISITATLTVFLYASANYNFSKELNLCCTILSVLSLFFCGFIFAYNGYIQKQENELFALQAQEQKSKLDTEFYSMLEQKNNEQQLFAHDIKHHLNSISMMDDVTEIRNYIQTLQPVIDDVKYIGKTGNKMLDLILSKYSSICCHSNVKFSADMRQSNIDFIENNDLTSLLGNLLDNAVEAAKKFR